MTPAHAPRLLHVSSRLIFAAALATSVTATAHADDDVMFTGQATATIYGSTLDALGGDFTASDTLPLMQNSTADFMLSDDRTDAQATMHYGNTGNVYNFDLTGNSGDLTTSRGYAYTEVHAHGQLVLDSMTRIAVSLSNFGVHNLDFSLRQDETNLLHAQYDWNPGTGEVSSNGFELEPDGHAMPLYQMLELEAGTYDLDVAIYNNIDGRGPGASSDRAMLTLAIMDNSSNDHSDGVAPPHAPTPSALGAGLVLLGFTSLRRRRST